MRSNSNLPGRLASEETSLSYQIIYYEDPSKSELTIKGAKGLERGEEALSAPYCYDVLVETTSTDAEDYRAWLGRRVEFQSMCNGKVLQAVGGIVTSVFSGPVELYEDSSTGWFKLRIEPEFVTACYSRNRKVYNGSKEDVLTTIAGCWNTVCKVTDKAKARIPSYLQLVQNDESDYNFFCRLLAAWGLGYYWTMEATPENGNAGGDDETIVRETLNVFSVLDGEIQGSAAALACMSSRDGNLPSWSLHTGFHSLDSGKMDVQDYLHGSVSEPVLSVPDASWDQLTSDPDPDSPNYSIHHFLSNHFNANSVHGLYRYVSSESESKAATVDQVAALKLGDMVTWADGASYDKAGYFLTKRVVSGDSDSWSVELTGRASVKVDTMDVGCGVLPRPLYPASDPDLNEDAPLLQAAPWESPKPRTFMAVVTSDTVRDSQGRNFCKVREITGQQMWVEMGSPSADSSSGILARPRVGNVLFCLDRGDFSIPIAISAMFRSSSSSATNETPLTKLKVMDRHERTMQDARVNDNSGLTLRSRTHVPERTYTDGTKGDARDKSITADDLEFVQRPQSVADLAENPKPFSQIQMFSLDNGVKPIKQDPDISNTYLASTTIETVAGFVTDCDYSAGYSMCDMANAVQTDRNTPISRPHLQGISLYSSGDLLSQSADHQLINAGGEIVLTSAQGITLRVGKSFVRITEYGIELSSTAGLVHNPGAYPAYHPEDKAEEDDTMRENMGALAGGHVLINGAGVYTKGPYVANSAVNMFSADTLLGSAFTLSDFNARLYAPSVNVIGGAALENSVVSIFKDAVYAADDIMATVGPAPVYTGTLENGYKTSGYSFSDILGGVYGLANKVIGGVGNCADIGKNFANAFSVTGSMIKMMPERMVLSSLAHFEYSATAYKVSSPVAGLIATAENTSFSGNGKLAKLGATAAVISGGFINNLMKQIMSGSSSSGDDTFTASGGEPTVPPIGWSTSGDVSAMVGVVAGGVIGALVGTFSPAEGLAQCLYSSKKSQLLAVQSEEHLNKTVTTAVTNSQTDSNEITVSLSSTKTIAKKEESLISDLSDEVDKKSHIVDEDETDLNNNILVSNKTEEVASDSLKSVSKNDNIATKQSVYTIKMEA